MALNDCGFDCAREKYVCGTPQIAVSTASQARCSMHASSSASRATDGASSATTFRIVLALRIVRFGDDEDRRLGRRTGERERVPYSWLEAQRTAAQRRANGTRVGRIQTRYTLNLQTHRCGTQTRGPVCLTSHIWTPSSIFSLLFLCFFSISPEPSRMSLMSVTRDA